MLTQFIAYKTFKQKLTTNSLMSYKLMISEPETLGIKQGDVYYLL